MSLANDLTLYREERDKLFWVGQWTQVTTIEILTGYGESECSSTDTGALRCCETSILGDFQNSSDQNDKQSNLAWKLVSYWVFN